MPETIGRITVPTVINSGQTFPLSTRYPFGFSVERPVSVHRFGSHCEAYAHHSTRQTAVVPLVADQRSLADPGQDEVSKASRRWVTRFAGSDLSVFIYS